MLSTQSHNSSRQLSNLSQRELEDVILKESRQTVRSQPETGYESPRIVLDRNPDEWQVKVNLLTCSLRTSFQRNLLN